MLSRTYCPKNEDCPSKFIYRPLSSPNFFVLEEIEHLPLPDQLRVVLTSYPRGLSLTFSLQKNLNMLPTSKAHIPNDLAANFFS